MCVRVNDDEIFIKIFSSIVWCMATLYYRLNHEIMVAKWWKNPKPYNEILKSSRKKTYSTEFKKKKKREVNCAQKTYIYTAMDDLYKKFTMEMLHWLWSVAYISLLAGFFSLSCSYLLFHRRKKPQKNTFVDGVY